MSDDDFSRRTFLKGVGLTAGVATLGVGASGSAAAGHGLSREYANPRTREAAKVWAERPWRQGFRGRRDRTMVVNDSGIVASTPDSGDPDHPDLGPWNGVTAVAKDTDPSDSAPEVQLTTPEALEARAKTREMVGDPKTQTEVLGPGTTVEGSETTFPPFTVPGGKDIVDMDAELAWTPGNVDLPVTVVVSEAGEDQSFRAELNVGDPVDSDGEAEWITLQTVDTGANPETLSNITVVPGAEHRFVAGQFANVASEGTVTYSFHTYDEELDTVDADSVFDFSGFDQTPKTVGWFDSGARYGTNVSPKDPDGHGSHVAGIMAGSGQASTVDADSYVEESPRTVLTAGDTIQYEVTADAGTGVFGVATGEGIEVLVEGPTGETLRTSANVPPLEEARVDHPTVDEDHPGPKGDRGPATYTILVRPVEGEAASTGRVNEVAAGAFAPADSEAAAGPAGESSLHTGVAPEAGLVGVQGLSGPMATMALYGDDLAQTFNIRAMNSSWGGLVPGGGTVGGSSIERAARRIAEAGVLQVAAAGNNFGTINGTPALSDEVVSAAATDDLDGITAYSDGGAQAQDEDGEGTYGKPDVCAPGGTLVTGARSVKAPAEGTTDGVEGTRDYLNLAGTSMASPYTCGAVALLADAMEFGAPEPIRLPSPSELHADGMTAEDRLEHTMHLKSVLLATASSTAFTAAPYHKHAVRYVHDGRDTYEGYGRINPDTAVDAVTRDLLPGAGDLASEETTKATISGRVGLDVPEDSRAVAGYVDLGDGALEVSLSHTHYSGGNKGTTQGAPWLDLFVYDAESGGRAGEPITLASAMGQQGAASVSVDGATLGTDTVFVVAKLVNVPGVVNGYDVQSNFDVGLDYTAPALPAFSVGGSREDDGRVFTSGQTNTVELTVDSLPQGVSEVRVTDFVPTGWEVTPFGDYVNDSDAPERDGVIVDLGTVTEDDIANGNDTVMYFAEANGGVGQYTFGPAEATIVTGDASKFGNETTEFTGTDSNTIAGADQNDLPL